MVATSDRLQTALAALVFATFARESLAVTVLYNGTFADYFGDTYDGGNDVTNQTEKEWLAGGARFNGTWKAPGDTPYIIVEGYGDVDLSDAINNTSVDKRQVGNRSFNGFGSYNCGGSNNLNVYNFGCGGGCIHFVNGLSSGSLYRQYLQPYPTGEMYDNAYCGAPSQHIGITGNNHSGCSNACCGWWYSAYFYYNC